MSDVKFQRISKQGLAKILHNRVKLDDAVVFLSFYSPQCGLCHALMPEMKSVLSETSFSGTKPAYYYAFNILDEPTWEKKLSFEGVPTIMVVRPDPKLPKSEIAPYEVLEQEGDPHPKTWYHIDNIKEFIQRSIK